VHNDSNVIIHEWTDIAQETGRNNAHATITLTQIQIQIQIQALALRFCALRS
jgi:hypothetical protein